MRPQAILFKKHTMNISGAIVFALFMPVLCVKPVMAKEFKSPDGRFIVRIAYGDQKNNYEIRDNKTGRLDTSIELLTRLFWLRWSGDSKTFVAVDQLAHGSYAQVFHFDGKKWIYHDVKPPEKDLESYAVVGAFIKPHLITITSTLSYLKGSDSLTGFGFCGFDFNIESGHLSNIRVIPIDTKTYELLQMLVDKDLLPGG